MGRFICGRGECGGYASRPIDVLQRLTAVISHFTIRILGVLAIRLRNRALATGRSESEIVRAALQKYLSPASRRRTAYDLAEEAGLIGCVPRGPKNLSTQRRAVEGFGKRK